VIGTPACSRCRGLSGKHPVIVAPHAKFVCDGDRRDICRPCAIDLAGTPDTEDHLGEWRWIGSRLPHTGPPPSE